MFVENTLRRKCSERDEENSEWITKEEFNALFPKGYRECNFFSQPCEYWAMNGEALKRKQNAEPLIPLSSLVEEQSQLQNSFLIHHTADTKLFTDLLQGNQYIEKRSTGSGGDGPQQKKRKLDFDTINTIEKLNNEFIKDCYICGNVCNCSVLRSMTQGKRKQSVTLISKELPELPDIELIDNFNNISLKLITPFDRHKLQLSDIHNNCIVNSNERSNGFAETIMNEVENLREKDDYGEASGAGQDDIVLYKVNEIEKPTPNTSIAPRHSVEAIQESTKTEENEGFFEDIKTYFHLNNISNMFEDLFINE